ncbi:hypothetical protein K439DRAFT_1286458, partial [Ramaria rubella]
MPFHHISSDLKQRSSMLSYSSLWLLDNGYTPDEVCHMLGVSLSSMCQWGDNFEEHRHVLPPPNPNQGWPHILDTGKREVLVELIQQSPQMYLDELQDWLALEHEVLVVLPTLDRNIREAGLTYKLLQWAAAERDEEAR